MRLVTCGGYSLNTLTVAELATVAEKAWQIKRDATRQMLDDAQAGEDACVREMKALYDIRGTRLPAVMYALTINGARDIIAVACKAQGVDASAAMGDLSADAIVAVAAQLVGHDPDVVKSGDGGE